MSPFKERVFPVKLFVDDQFKIYDLTQSTLIGIIGYIDDLNFQGYLNNQQILEREWRLKNVDVEINSDTGSTLIQPDNMWIDINVYNRLLRKLLK